MSADTGAASPGDFGPGDVAPDGAAVRTAPFTVAGVPAQRELLSGWGRTAPTAAVVTEPAATTEVAALLGDDDVRDGRGLIARGLARSYGDAAQNAGGVVARMTAMDAVHDVDVERATVRVDAGVSLATLMRLFVPLGMFPAVTPGTCQVTVGGAVAADIHGKNHHVDGSFCDHVSELELVTPTGTHRVGPTEDPELFWATAGGMGLTGVVTNASLRMRRIETSMIAVDTERCSDLDDCMARMTERDDAYHYSVAWIDCLATGSAMGRSVLTRGDFAPRDALDAKAARDPLHFAPSTVVQAPPWFPNGLLNRLTVRAFNELWFRKAPRQRLGELQPIAAFHHPLDFVHGWNRIYGTNGFLQYQFVVPFGRDGEDALRRAIEALAASGCASFLAVLKRFGPANPGPLSFPTPGWTLALDVPAGNAELAPLFDRLDEMVLDAGGRLYFAKESRTKPQLVDRMYPRIDEWRAVRDRVDPDGVLVSDLARRLQLV
jgi:decaprenylphospho-beta-D-ribofuranose 2-oxidase